MVGSRVAVRQGRSSAGVAAALALVLLSPAASADRRDQRAADLYSEGVKLIRLGKYREGAARVNAALARGATEPVEAQGSETRFLARPYDPYYWLGVAQMETGLTEQALSNFEKSSTMIPKGRTQPVLADAPAEWEDLQRRKSLLLASLGVPPPVLVAAAPSPSPAPTPFSIRLSDRAVVAVPSAVPVLAAAPTPLPSRTSAPVREALPATALALRSDLAGLLAEPSVSVRVGDRLRGSLARLEAALGKGSAASAAAERIVRKELAGSAGQPVLRAALGAALEACRERRYEEAARLARAAGRLVPDAPQPHLLRAAALGTLWVLEGERRNDLETEAVEAYESWRSRRPAGAPQPLFLSPSLRKQLERPVPVPSRG
jgi:tetratricopeptide (TPR) repeat protein